MSGWMRWLVLAVMVSTFDRLSINPLFNPIAQDFATSIGAVAAVATSYLLLYGISQPVSGFVSDVRGRVPVLRIALAGGAVASALSAIAPNLVFLLAARGLAGAMYAAVFPTALVYTAEMVGFDERQREIANIMAATAVATAVSVVVSGAIASYASWRLVFIVPAVGSLVLAAALHRLPEPTARRSAGGLRQLRAVLGEPWAVYVILVAFPEGAALFGFLNYFAATLEAHGVTAAIAGGTFAMYGVGVLCSIPVMRRLSSRLPGAAMITLGGLGTIAAYSALSVNQGLLAVVVASLAAGWGFTVMHSTVQTWATEVAAEARGTAVSLFAAALFLGGGAGTAVVAPLAGGDHFATLFRVALAISVPVVVLLAAGRVLYRPPAPSLAAPDAADSF